MAGKRRRPERTAVIEGSGNVFADLELPRADEEMAKAQLASHLRRIILRRRLTQLKAAQLIGVDQPKVSALMNGRLAGFSSERLMHFLTALGLDVEIVVRTPTGRRARGQIRVSEAA
jgi:predicted XRE-type DNA-binding protein